MYTPIPGSSSMAHVYARCPILIVVTIAAGIFLANPMLLHVNNACENISMITFTFDDGYYSQFENAVPILDKYDYTGVAFVIVNDIGKESRMSYSDLKSLSNIGWEIGSHSMNHEHLTQISFMDAKNSIYNSKINLMRNGVVAYSFASPYGEYNSETLGYIKTSYKAHRTTNVGLNNIPVTSDEIYTLKSIVVNSDTKFEDIKNWMDKAKEEHKWLILTFHHVGEDGAYNVDIDTFERIVKYASENGFVNYL